MEADQPSFKVIIAGGSVAGLTLANALEKAGIDFFLIEKGDIAPQSGAGISVFPHTARVFDQLGAWDELKQATLPLLDRLHYDQDGRLFETTQVLKLVHEWSKWPFVFPERRTYLAALYNNLKDESRVRNHVGLVSFTEDNDGVTVFTSTGEEIRGSILVGADGIHSTVRKLIAESVANSDPQRAKDLNEAFTSYYRVIFGISKNQHQDDPGRLLLPDAIVHNVYYQGFSGIAVVGVSGRVIWFLFVKEDRPSTTPNCPRYSEKDAEDTLRIYGHHNVGPGYTFNNLWEQRVKAAMIPLEEGVVKGSWNSGGRVVLLGDCVSKCTINPGLGGNTAVEGVCRLVNELLPVLKETRNPGNEELSGVFGRYEEQQRPRANLCVTIASYIARFETMDTWWLKLLRVLSPWVPDSLKAKAYLYYMADAPLLNHLPDPDKNVE